MATIAIDLFDLYRIAGIVVLSGALSLLAIYFWPDDSTRY